MSNEQAETNDLLDVGNKESLKNILQATEEELKSLEKLIKIQREKMNSNGGNRAQPSVVIDNFLYHGDLGHAIDTNLLLDIGIQYIINLCDCPLDQGRNDVFTVLWIHDLEDHVQGNIRRTFDQTNDFLIQCKEKNAKVLVHCQAGISRSSSVVLAYLIKHDHLSLEKAYEFLLDRRPMAAPNYGFLIELIRYGKEIQNQNHHRENDQITNPIKPLENLSEQSEKF